MSNNVASDYYRRRERASMAMSLAAIEPGIRKIHLELANRYAQLIDDQGDGTASRRTLFETASKRPKADKAEKAMRSSALTTDFLALLNQIAAHKSAPNATRLPARNSDWSADVSTVEGYAFHIRRVVKNDADATLAFGTEFDPGDVQNLVYEHFRTVKGRHAQLATDDNDDRMIRYVALESDTDRIIAIATVVRHPVRPTAWAVLIIRPEFKDAGIRWRILAYIAARTQGDGVLDLLAIEQRSDLNHMLSSHRFGWRAAPFRPDDRYIVLKKSLRKS